MNISTELKQRAIELGLCEQWTNEWGQPDKNALLGMYITGIDFCIEHDYPSIEYIKANFKGVAEEHGVFTDNQNVILHNPDVAILNGDSTGVITLDKYVSRDIYVRHNSKVMITTSDSARAFIRVYDNASVFVNNIGNKRIFVYKHGNAKVQFSGDVLVRNS